MSIRTRVTLFGLGVVAVVLAVISALFLLLVVGSGPETQDQELAARAEAAVRSVRAAPASELVPRAPLTPADAETGVEIVVIVLDTRGQVLSTTGTVGATTPTVPADMLARADRAGRAGGTVTVQGVELRLHVRTWLRPEAAGYVVTAQALRRLAVDRIGTVAVVLIADLVALVAAAVAIWLATGRALRPLRQLAATADEVGRSADLTRRLPPVPQRDDVGRLTTSFNAMMARLERAYGRLAEAFAAQQRFTADASHELRTPLASIRANAGFLRATPDAAEPDRAAAVADIDVESARMSRLMDDLLTLARADGGQPLRLGPVDLEELAADVVRGARALHPDRTFHCASVPVTVPGDAEALRRLLRILLDNAVAYGREDGSVWVAVLRRNGGAVVHVSDDGPGIPPGLHARIFDRFFRADESRRAGGSGLGLSIAAWIVGAHGGRIEATNNDRGGATFVVELPGTAPLPAAAPAPPAGSAVASSPDS